MARTALFLNPGADLSPALALARRADTLGYESLWVTHGIGRDALQMLASDAYHRDNGSPEALVTLQLENEEMSTLIERCLNPREQEVLALRYGLDDGEPRTLGETGREVGVSRERVRQIEKRALQKLNLVLSGRKRGGVSEGSH